MPKWNKNAKEFTVKLTDDNAGSTICRVPKPVLEKLDNPKRISFVMDGRTIRVRPELEEAVKDLIKHKRDKTK